MVGFKGFSEKFSTRVDANPASGEVTATLIKGPFRKLKAVWSIAAMSNAQSTVSLFIDYDFRNPFIGWLASANHDLAVDRIMSAFLAEAERRYGASA